MTVVDDLDGTTLEDGAGETVRFALDGTSYEIDLSREHAGELRDLLAPYVKAGRTTGGARRAVAPAGSRNAKDELRAAREWLRAQGHQVSDRGRIPGHLLEEYRAKR
ncbi:Lsr2 family protein [Agromyces sp. MMS24-K17]|uniref:histone-like nucleoid-structuring protein Lsr2 n=1 Tax=Agromyces sp. MMS24-K17 TaxID=3372850 RepID=UPI0037546CA7